MGPSSHRLLRGFTWQRQQCLPSAFKFFACIIAGWRRMPAADGTTRAHHAQGSARGSDMLQPIGEEWGPVEKDPTGRYLRVGPACIGQQLDL